MAVNEQFLNEFERRNINPNYFMVSFDGVNCHDWLRGIKGAEEKAVNAIRLFKSRGYSVLVSMALHDGNAGSLLETYALMKELGVDYWKASPIVDTGTWKKQTEKSVNYAFIFEKYLELIKEYKADNMPMRLGLGGFFQGYPEEMIYRIPFSQGCGNCGRDGETLCESTRYFPYLLPDGRVLPCIAMSGSEMEEIAPNILDEGQSLEKALSNSPIDTYTRYTYGDLFERNHECAACKHKYVCSGCRANALACGGFFEKDPLACCFFKGGYEDMIKKIMA
jgi:radical SAM protein with 4Fe4S-binding SPASM domain